MTSRAYYFAFEMEDRVRIKRSDEGGRVIGAAIYLRIGMPQILVEYTAADGRATDGWFYEDELEADPDSD